MDEYSTEAFSRSYKGLLARLGLVDPPRADST